MRPDLHREREIRCLIVDDHEVVRGGLRVALSRSPRIRIVGEATDAARAVALAEEHRPDVVVMDIRLPGPSGLEATRALTERLPETGVLVFTGYGERELLRRGLEAGARGYLLKGAPSTSVIEAIERIASGEGYVDPSLAPGELTRCELLTAREREVLQLVADGCTNAEIATGLSISEETVKSHVRRILEKLHAGTRTQAVAIGLRDSIIG